VAAVIALGFLREAFDGDSQRAALMAWHRQIGLTILLLTALRLVLRLLTRAPGASPDWPPLLRTLSLAGHVALYGLLIGMPLLGWLNADARGQDPALFGWTLPQLVERDRDAAEFYEEAHETGAWLLIALIGLHTAAALWHHYLRHDGLLVRMLPGPRTTAEGVRP